jgi:predicted metal-dependent phosphoesterase TrpH
MPELSRVDLHVHSSASYDCKVEPEQVVARCRRLGLSPIFLTDHNRVFAAARLQALGIDDVVVGEEVMTTQGELIGLFLQHRVLPDLTPLEAANHIKEQGGLVYLEHPYDSHRRHLSEDAIEAVSSLIDIVEVFNGRSDEKANQRAADLCAILGAAPGAGSDAHTIDEIGSVYLQMESFEGASDFLAKLDRAKIVKGRSKFLLMAEATLRHKIRGR